jgi:chitinase
MRRQWRVLTLLGLLLLSLTAHQARAQTVSCTGVPTFNNSTIYNPGDRVVHNGKLYQANVQIWNAPPDYCPSCGWWTLLGTCGTGGGDTTPPSVPSGLGSPSKTSSSVSLTWNGSTDNAGGSGVQNYDVLRNGTIVGTPTATSFTVTGLAPGTTYSFTVRARDNAGNVSAQSAALSVTTNPSGTCSTLPSVPTGLNSPSKTNNSVSLAWNASSPGANCTVEYRVFRGGSQVAQVSATSHMVTGLAASTTYSFTVAAVNSFGSSAQSGAISVTTDSNPPPSTGTKILGYFVQWGVYARNYHVKNIHTSGSAQKLTHINYAFGNVVNGQCVLGDTYADYDRFYDATSSVDGVADTWDAGALRGNFGQLRRLKRMYPHLKVLFSFGGWTWSGGFGQAAANPTAFANSCYNLVEDPRWADVFDGIDIDWEYPNACGLSCDSSGPAAFRNLMAALRQRFGSGNLVTAAITADATSGGKIDAADYAGAAQSVDWYNVMTYDFFGAWAATGPTAPHSPLTSYTGIPIQAFNSDAAIQKLKGKGIPASKLLLGIGFYGRGWTGVPNVGGGLNQPASGPAPGTFEQGIEDYKVISTRCPPTGTAGGTSFAYCGGQWWGYDTPGTIAGKMSYRRNQGLGGAFFWELSGDTSGGPLITAIYNNR